MNQTNDTREPVSNMERLKEEAAACGAGCGCHASGGAFHAPLTYLHTLPRTCRRQVGSSSSLFSQFVKSESPAPSFIPSFALAGLRQTNRMSLTVL